MFTAVLEGRLSREVRVGQNAKTNNKVTNVTIAVEMGETKKITRFIDCAFWGALADEASTLVKGQAVKVKVNNINCSFNEVPKKGGKKGEVTIFTNIQTTAIALQKGALPRSINNVASPDAEQAVGQAPAPQMPVDVNEELPF